MKGDDPGKFVRLLTGMPLSPNPGGKPSDLPECFDRVNESEQQFIDKLRHRARGGTVLRNGWPDFLVRESMSLFYAVEVKQPTDVVRKNQAIMFEVLERLGLKVFVWNPDDPDRLHPWSKWPREGSSSMKPERRHKPVRKVADRIGRVPQGW